MTTRRRYHGHAIGSRCYEERALTHQIRPTLFAGAAARPGARSGRGRGLIALLILPAVATLGAAVAIQPIVAPLLVAVVAGLWLVALGAREVAVFHGFLGLILVGYAFSGRGFAYIGVPPVFVGEVALGLGLLAIVMSLARAHFGKLHLLLIAYMTWGLVRTVPYVNAYGVDALRDAVLWAYGFFAVAVSITLSVEHVNRLVTWYRRLLPWFLVWVPIAVFLTAWFADALPHAPGSSVPIVDIKAGDMGVHLAGAAAFVLLGLYARAGRTTLIGEFALWTAWLTSLGLVASLNRGAMAAAAAAAAALLFVRRASGWMRLAMVGFLLVGVVALLNPQVETRGSRTVSFDQLVQNFTSIFANQSNSTNQATKEWRFEWWGTIVTYTVDGPYFWTGKGFGVNLADDDGFQVNADGSLRAPHSVNLDVLARTGVPGLALWVAFNLAFGGGLLRAAYRANGAGRAFWVPVLGWVFVYWLAALVNGSVDVYLEGPQGGIWFWAVVGFGMAAMRLSRNDPAPSSKVPCES